MKESSAAPLPLVCSSEGFDDSFIQNEVLCSSMVKQLETKAKEKFVNKFFSSGENVSFSTQEAFDWLPSILDNLSLLWDISNYPIAISLLWNKGYLDLAEHTPDLTILELTSIFIASTPEKSQIRRLKINTNSKRLGQAFQSEGFTFKHPIVIIPGLASSALSVWSSEYAPAWVGSRIWIDFSKVGTNFKLPNLFEKDDEKIEHDFGMFVKHMILSDDGISDPPGIRVRPMSGLGAISSLSPSNRITSGVTTIFGTLIKNLLDVGYDPKNLVAAPYDWRLPAALLEERDGYFTRLASSIENLYKLNGNQRVVMLCHSNGNRMAHYFTHWVDSKYPGWAKTYIHAMLALGAPYLGSPKVARAVITGDALGLDLFMKSVESQAWGRHMASYPVLMPLQDHLLPSNMLMVDTSCVHGEGEEETFPSDHFWVKYQHDESDIGESSLTSIIDTVEFSPALLSGTWRRKNKLSVPALPSSQEDYVPHVKGWIRSYIIRSIISRDAEVQEYSTARNGFKEISHLASGHTKATSFPFDHLKEISSLHIKHRTTVSCNGKRIITVYRFPSQTRYSLSVVLVLCGPDSSTLRKEIIVTRDSVMVDSMVRFYEREVMLSSAPVDAFIGKEERVGDFYSPSCASFMKDKIPMSFRHYKTHLCEEPFIVGSGKPHLLHDVLPEEDMVEEYPILCPPVGVEKLWCIYGTQVKTEVSYYISTSGSRLALNSDADDFSECICDNNPSGLYIEGGIGYETGATMQPCLGGEATASGDGTVPYYSLSHCKSWVGRKDVDVEVREVADQEHTEMLKNEEVLYHILRFLSNEDETNK